MRIVFVSIDDFDGPTTKQLHHLACALGARAHTCLILVRGNPRSLERLGRASCPRVEIARYGFIGHRLNRRTRRLVRTFDPDVIHCYELRVGSYEASRELARASNAPLVVHFADEDTVLFKEAGRTARRRLARPVLRQAARLLPTLWPFWDPRFDEDLRLRAAGLDAVTPALAALVEQRFGRRCTVLVPPVPPEQASFEADDASLLRSLGLEGQRFILYAGAVFGVHLDDFRVFLRAFSRLAERDPELLLVQTGHRARRLAPDALACETGAPDRVRLVGYLPLQRQVFQLMRNAAVLVQPGLPSAFNRYRLPSKLPDYLLSGRPVITFAIGAGEMLEDGRDALLTHSGEPAELAAQIERLLSDEALARRIGEAGRRRAMELFDSARAANTAEELYRSALGVGAEVG